MNKHRKAAIGLAAMDWWMAWLAWLVFFGLRKYIEGYDPSWTAISQDTRLWQGLTLIPLCWMLLMAFIGSYKQVLAASRLSSLQEMTAGVLLGSLVLLFGVLSDDLVLDIKSYLFSFVAVFGIHLAAFGLGRLSYLTALKWMLRHGFIKWQVQIYGAYDPSEIPDYISLSSFPSSALAHWNTSTLRDVDEMWIGRLAPSEIKRILPLIVSKKGPRQLLLHESTWKELDYNYRVLPKLRLPYVELLGRPMAWWQLNIKRLGDIMVSVIALLLLSPVLLMVAVGVKFSSEGTILYCQERIGRWGIPFEIIKFRTMYQDAEWDGPTLAAVNDPRCTPIGSWLRRWRIDEIPQFVNVLVGDMSIVGPRPERAFYANQLINKNHLYPLLWQVKPGITSWGQIKYGYASNLHEMIQRFRFDLLYMERMALLLDIRIIYYTLIVLIQGKGK